VTTEGVSNAVEMLHSILSSLLKLMFFLILFE
jgi:hypothetical protein